MMGKIIIDNEILSILNDYHLFIDSVKKVEMPFYVDEIDKNHVTSLKGESILRSSSPLGNTTLECEIKEGDEFNYSIKILSDAIKTRVLFRMDEGQGTHRNSHFNVPVEQQQVPCPHFHLVGDDGIVYAYRTKELELKEAPIVIQDGFKLFCNECHINQDNAQIIIQERGTLPFEYEPEIDPLKGIVFP